MLNRMVPVLLMTAMLYALGAGISSIPRHSIASTTLAGVATSAPAAAIPTLPTIVVHPDVDAGADPTLLPVVTVYPNAAEIAAAHALDARTLGTGAVVVAVHALGGGMAPRSGLDMPYYSFGRSVYRVSKE